MLHCTSVYYATQWKNKENTLFLHSSINFWSQCNKIKRHELMQPLSCSAVLVTLQYLWSIVRMSVCVCLEDVSTYMYNRSHDGHVTIREVVMWQSHLPHTRAPPRSQSLPRTHHRVILWYYPLSYQSTVREQYNTGTSKIHNAVIMMKYFTHKILYLGNHSFYSISHQML